MNEVQSAYAVVAKDRPIIFAAKDSLHKAETAMKDMRRSGIRTELCIAKRGAYWMGSAGWGPNGYVMHIECKMPKPAAKPPSAPDSERFRA